MLILPSDMPRRIKAERCRRDFGLFVREMWPLVEPVEYVHGRHIDAINEHLTAVRDGQIRNLVVNIPPRSMKSINIAVMFPAWVWLEQAWRKFLTGSYAEELSVRDAVKSRDVMRHPNYQALLKYIAEERGIEPWRFKGDQNAKSRYENNVGGHRVAVSVGGATTGDGGDILVMDDPLSAKGGDSKVKLEEANTYWDRTFSTRVNDRKTAAKILVMQRLNENDVTGHVLASGLGYDHLFLPMEFSKRVILGGVEFNPLERPTSIGWTDWRKDDGELLWPERNGPAEVEQMRIELGPYGYAGQAQQTPTPMAGGMLKRDWWQFYGGKNKMGLPGVFDRVLMSWDLAFKDSDGSDFVAGTVWGFKGADSYLLDGINERLDFNMTEQAIKLMVGAHPNARARLVEDKANGPAVMNHLKREVRGLIAVQPLGSKEARVSACVPAVAAGNVFLPDPLVYPKMARFVKEFIEQCRVFPKGDHDDMVDSFTMAHIWAWDNGQPKVHTGKELKAAARAQAAQ